MSIQRNPLTRVLYLLAGLAFVLTMVIALLVGMTPTEPARMRFAYVAVGLLLGTGVIGLLLGLAHLLERPTELPHRTQATLETICEALQRLAGLRGVSPLSSSEAASQSPAGHSDRQFTRGSSVSAASADSASVASTTAEASAGRSSLAGDESLQHLAMLLGDLRDCVLMTEAQRQHRYQQLQQERKMNDLSGIQSLISHAQWESADRVVSDLVRQFPDDPDVQAARQQLATAARGAEAMAYEAMRQQAGGYASLSDWDDALAEADNFIRRFPNSQAGKDYLVQLTHERDVYIDSTAERLFGEIKTDIEHRQWRRALETANRLIERCPQHLKAQAIRQQMQVIQENAEVELRKGIEARIQELLKAKRYGEAIEAANGLIRQYPLSPQAKAAEELLPRLRGLLESDSLQKV